MNFKKIITIFLLTVMSVTYIPAVSATAGVYDNITEILNLNDLSSFSSNDKGFTFSTENTLNNKSNSLYWNHDTMTGSSGVCRLEFYSVPKDWTEFVSVDLSVFGKNYTNAQVKLIIFSEDNLGYFSKTLNLSEGQNNISIPLEEFDVSRLADWSRIKYIWISASGWNMKPTAGAEFWLNSFNVTNNYINILNFNDKSSFASASKGFEFSNEHTLNSNLYSLYWNHNTMTDFNGNCRMEFSNIPKSWSEYEIMDLSIFGEKCSGAQFVLVAVCSDDLGYFRTTITMSEGQNLVSVPLSNFQKSKTTADWSQISYIWLTASGWGMNPTNGAEFWVNSFKIRNKYVELENLYDYSDLKTVYNALTDGVAVYADSKNVVKGRNVTTYKGTEYKNETVTVPLTLFSDYLGATLEGNTLTHGENVLNANTYEFSIPAYSSNGELYVPAIEAAEILGYKAMKEKKLAVIGDEKIFNLNSNKKDNVLTEIAAYLAYHTDINPDEISKDDMTVIKDRWRAYLVGDDSYDLTDSIYKNVLTQIKNNGNSSWKKYKTAISEGREYSLFRDAVPSASSDMTNEYSQIRNMALAWAQKGQELYHNEELLQAILYSLEWMYEKRFGQDELENNENAWRDHTLTNWYDWQIATPQHLVDIMMLIEDKLTDEQRKKYLSVFEHWIYDHCYRSMFADAGMNVLYTAECWIGMALLNNDAKEAALAVSALHNCFAWADEFPTNEGFFTDGSMVFHYKHAMTGTYGQGQYSKSGMILGILKNTKLDFKNPRKENIFDWTFDAFEPLIFDGEVFHMVMGRSNGSGHYVTRNVIIGMLDLLEFADGENLARMKSLIKYLVQIEKSNNKISYNDKSFTIPQLKKLNDVMNDTSVLPRDDYYISKVYNNMDKAVHQRKDWAFGVSMSSSRIYDYECIHGENTTGWYTGDGMTQLMLADDNYQFHTDYWKTVNPYKYPGVTLDTQKRVAHTINTGQAFVKNFDDVGGVSLNNEYSLATQHLNAFYLKDDIVQTDGAVISAHHSSLTARKAWFMFDDEVVCLGSDINANDGFEVQTVVENRISDNDVTAENEILSLTADETDLTGKSWAHLENTAGYYFPDGGTIKADKTANGFFELWLSHGINPENRNYSYVILPTLTSEETAEYAKNPDTYIICNTENIQAVADRSTETVGIVFHKAGTLGGITVSEPMALMLREKEGSIEISVSDTTHKLKSAVVTFDRMLENKGKTDYRMNIDESGKVINVNFSDSDGACIESEFKINNYLNTILINSFDFNENKLICNITNNSLRFFDCSVILSEYSDNNLLRGLNRISLSVPPLTNINNETEITGKAASYKGFLWQNLEPLIPAITK